MAAQVLPDLELLQVAFAQSTYRVLPILLRVSFFAFPAVSSLAFKAFRCDDLDASDEAPGPAVMSADLSVTCWDENGVNTAEYLRICAIAVVAIIVYSVLLPLGYAALLFRVRKDIWDETPTPVSRAAEFLTSEYDKAFFFWELIEVMPCPH